MQIVRYRFNTLGCNVSNVDSICIIWQYFVLSKHLQFLTQFQSVSHCVFSFSLVFQFLQITTDYYRLLVVPTGYYMLLHVSKYYYRLLQVTLGYYRFLQVTTGYYSLLHFTKGCYK